jgi:hypothetical protein
MVAPAPPFGELFGGAGLFSGSGSAGSEASGCNYSPWPGQGLQQLLAVLEFVSPITTPAAWKELGGCEVK